jgi:hypothetical protein
VGTEGSFLREHRLGHEAHHSPPSDTNSQRLIPMRRTPPWLGEWLEGLPTHWLKKAVWTNYIVLPPSGSSVILGWRDRHFTQTRKCNTLIPYTNE